MTEYRLRLEEQRKKAGFATQDEAASALGMTWRRYSALERGETRLLISDAVHISDVFGCTPNDLCGWYEDHPEDRPCSDSVVAFRSQETELQALYDRCSPEVQSAAMAVVRSGAGSDADAHTAGSSPHSISI